jgi:hypothetical protein
LNQENICCLNTALVFFVHANRNSELVTMLRMLRELELLEAKPGFVLKPLRQLMKFWKFFYGVTKREQDCESLERSSKIPFSEWRCMVDILLEPAETGESSISYWLDQTEVRSAASGAETMTAARGGGKLVAVATVLQNEEGNDFGLGVLSLD